MECSSSLSARFLWKSLVVGRLKGTKTESFSGVQGQEEHSSLRPFDKRHRQLSRPVPFEIEESHKHFDRTKNSLVFR